MKALSTHQPRARHLPFAPLAGRLGFFGATPKATSPTKIEAAIA